jgi:Family of unknown function (DUF5994)
MTTSPSTPAHTPASRAPLRMQLAEPPASGPISGVWWPQSRNLQVEAADLVDHFPGQVGHINRLLFSRPDWDNPVVDGRGVRRIQARRGPVKVGSFPSDDTHLMILLLASGRRVSLKVIASATDPVEADRQLRANGHGNSSGATDGAAPTASKAEEPGSWM